jgi:hypothetical protein
MAQFLLVRRDDLVHIGLQFSGFRLEQVAAAGGSRPRLVAAASQASITVTFPPQALSENLLNLNTSSTGHVFRIPAMRAGASQVKFAVPANTTLELNAQGVLAALQGAGVTIVPSAFDASDQPTAIEIPWGLVVSPAPRVAGHAVVSTHTILPVTSSPAGVTGLWHARLQATGADANDANLALVALRSITGDMSPPGPLPQDLRDQIVAQMEGDHPRLPNARRLELSTIGGSLAVAASWRTLEWSHEVILGRDRKIRTVVAGVLYPFGHRALVTTVTERDFVSDQPSSPNPSPPPGGDPPHHGNGNGNGNGNGGDPPSHPRPQTAFAGLVATSMLEVVEPVRMFTHNSRHGRQFPFDAVEIIGRTFPIVTSFDPAYIIAPTAGTAPPTEQNALRFPVRCAGANGEVVLHIPMLFVQDRFAGDMNRLGPLWTEVRRRLAPGSAAPGVPVDLPGVAVNMFTGQGPGNDLGDIHEVYQLVIDGPADGATFHPVVAQFTAELPTLRTLQQKASVSSRLAYTDDFLNQQGRPDVALTMLDPVLIDFTSNPQRSGGLMAPNYKAESISRKDGPKPKEALDQALRGATLLGLPLLDIVAAGSLAAPTIMPLAGNPPGVSMTWALKLKQSGPFVPNGDSAASVTIYTADPPAGAIGADHQPAKRGVTCQVENFQLVLPPPPSQALVRLTFDAVTFTEEPGKHPDLTFKNIGLKFDGALHVLDRLMTAVQGLIGHNAPTIRALPSGVSAGYSLAIPSVQTGDFLLQNVAVNVAVDIPFSHDPVTVRLGFASRDNPFNLSVMALGGGGYIELEIGKNGEELSRFEAAMEFGATVSINFLIATAEVHALGGVRFVKQPAPPTLELDAYIRIGGSVQVFGLVTVSIEMLVQLGYRPTPNTLVGHATLVIEVDLTLFDESVTLDSGDWTLSGPSLPHIGSHAGLTSAAAAQPLAGLMQYLAAFEGMGHQP